MKAFWPWLCALLSGILLALCFPPADLGGMVWFALVPLISALWFSTPWARRNLLRLFLLGYLMGMGYFLGCFFWINMVTVPGTFLLCCFLALYPACWTVLVGTIGKPRPKTPDHAASAWLRSWPNILTAVFGAASWVALEWGRGFLMFSGFGWDGLGIALHDNIALIQICEFTGVGGLTFLIVMVNMMIVLTAKRLSLELGREKLRPHYDFSLTVVLVALAFGYGVRQLFAPKPPTERITVAAVQANIPIQERRNPEQQEKILKLQLDLSEKALLLKPDLLVWPEAATPRPLFSDQNTWDLVRELARKSEGDFLLGTVYFGPEGDFNSAVLLTEQAQTAQLYHKIHLVPFGEYVPLRHGFPFFAWVVGDLVADDFDFGTEHKVLQMQARDIKIAALICFEDSVGDLVRYFAQGGAQLLVTLTNDGWFKDSAGPLQHLRQAVFRCAETKIPMIRAANTGVSCLIDRYGRVQQELEDEKGSTFIEGLLIVPVDVPKYPVQTFYTKYGEVFSMACSAVTFLWIGISFRRRRS